MKFSNCSIEHLMPKQRTIPLGICFFGHSCIPAAFQHFYSLYFLSIMLHKLPITTRCHSQPKGYLIPFVEKEWQVQQSQVNTVEELTSTSFTRDHWHKLEKRQKEAMNMK